jgi:hypothetical protein
VWQEVADQAIDAGKRFVSTFTFPRGGKSFWAAHNIVKTILVPNKNIWIVAPTYQLGSKEFMYVWNALLNLGFLRMANEKHKDIRGGRMKISFPWGSFLEVVSADNPISLRAEELDLVVLAEASALPENIYYHHLYARIQKRKGITLIPTTPKGRNWIYEAFRLPSRKLWWGRENKKYDDEYFSLVVSSDPELVDPTNPDLADLHEGSVYDLQTVQRAKEIMPAPIFIEQFGGGFASYAGLVFQYDVSKHRVPNFSIPNNWTHVVGWDHGSGPDPTAILIISYDPDGKAHFWGEIYEKEGKPITEFWDRIQARIGSERSITDISVDPSAKQVRVELASKGIIANIPKLKSVDAGIIRLTALMKEGKFAILEGECPNFEKELLHLEWDDKNPGRIRDGQADHAVSAARYGTLLPVELPMFPMDQQIKESEAVKRMWAEIRMNRKEKEKAKEAEKLDSKLFPNMLDEDMWTESLDQELLRMMEDI